jgi:hypothetical protein
MFSDTISDEISWLHRAGEGGIGTSTLDTDQSLDYEAF